MTPSTRPSVRGATASRWPAKSARTAFADPRRRWRTAFRRWMGTVEGMDDQFRPGRMLARGLARRCPKCGGGKLLRSWFKMHDACPTCGHCLNREEGFWLGSFVVNFAVMEVG